jgi:hypothetical protein
MTADQGRILAMAILLEGAIRDAPALPGKGPLASIAEVYNRLLADPSDRYGGPALIEFVLDAARRHGAAVPGGEGKSIEQRFGNRGGKLTPDGLLRLTSTALLPTDRGRAARATLTRFTGRGKLDLPDGDRRQVDHAQASTLFNRERQRNLFGAQAGHLSAVEIGKRFTLPESFKARAIGDLIAQDPSRGTEYGGTGRYQDGFYSGNWSVVLANAQRLDPSLDERSPVGDVLAASQPPAIGFNNPEQDPASIALAARLAASADPDAERRAWATEQGWTAEAGYVAALQGWWINDSSSPWAQAMTLAAAQRLGDPSDMARSLSHLQAKAAEWEPGTLVGQDILDSAEGPALRQAVMAIYDHTQARLADYGLRPDDLIELYRGIGPDNEIRTGDTAIADPLTSWSSNPAVALSFTKVRRGGSVLSGSVPARSILMLITDATGYGGLHYAKWEWHLDSQEEFVTLGGPVNVTVTRTQDPVGLLHGSTPVESVIARGPGFKSARREVYVDGDNWMHVVRSAMPSSGMKARFGNAGTAKLSAARLASLMERAPTSPQARATLTRFGIDWHRPAAPAAPAKNPAVPERLVLGVPGWDQQFTAHPEAIEPVMLALEAEDRLRAYAANVGTVTDRWSGRSEDYRTTIFNNAQSLQAVMKATVNDPDNMPVDVDWTSETVDIAHQTWVDARPFTDWSVHGPEDRSAWLLAAAKRRVSGEDWGVAVTNVARRLADGTAPEDTYDPNDQDANQRAGVTRYDPFLDLQHGWALYNGLRDPAVTTPSPTPLYRGMSFTPDGKAIAVGDRIDIAAASFSLSSDVADSFALDRNFDEESQVATDDESLAATDRMRAEHYPNASRVVYVAAPGTPGFDATSFSVRGEQEWLVGGTFTVTAIDEGDRVRYIHIAPAATKAARRWRMDPTDLPADLDWPVRPSSGMKARFGNAHSAKLTPARLASLLSRAATSPQARATLTRFGVDWRTGAIANPPAPRVPRRTLPRPARDGKWHLVGNVDVRALPTDPADTWRVSCERCGGTGYVTSGNAAHGTICYRCGSGGDEPAVPVNTATSPVPPKLLTWDGVELLDQHRAQVAADEQARNEARKAEFVRKLTVFDNAVMADPEFGSRMARLRYLDDMAQGATTEPPSASLAIVRHDAVADADVGNTFDLTPHRAELARAFDAAEAYTARVYPELAAEVGIGPERSGRAPSPKQVSYLRNLLRRSGINPAEADTVDDSTIASALIDALNEGDTRRARYLLDASAPPSSELGPVLDALLARHQFDPDAEEAPLPGLNPDRVVGDIGRSLLDQGFALPDQLAARPANDPVTSIGLDGALFSGIRDEGEASTFGELLTAWARLREQRAADEVWQGTRDILDEQDALADAARRTGAPYPEAEIARLGDRLRAREAELTAQAEAKYRIGPSLGYAVMMQDAWSETTAGDRSAAMITAAANQFPNPTMTEGLQAFRQFQPGLAASAETIVNGPEAPAIGAFMATTYAATQRFLADNGFPPGSTVTLYRGVSTGADQVGGEVLVNPLSSFTTDRSIAERFSRVDWGLEGQGGVITAQVPVERIFSIAGIGPGHLASREVVVLGGRLPASADLTFRPTYKGLGGPSYIDADSDWLRVAARLIASASA